MARHVRVEYPPVHVRLHEKSHTWFLRLPRETFRSSCNSRGITAVLLLKYCGHTHTEIAKLLNVSRGATVSKQIIRTRKLIAEDSELRSQVERCEKHLNELRVTEQLLNA